MDDARLFLCARCRRQVLICSRCDRGQRYCGARCSGPARRESLRAAGRRYQHSRRGRHCRAERQRRYGLPAFGGGFTGTPNVGFGLSDSARDYTLGWRLTPARDGSGFEVNLDATRREPAGGNEAPEHGVMLRGAIRW